jgi:hypothetical protein
MPSLAAALVTSCASTSQPDVVPGPVYLSLVWILAHPDSIPDGQEVAVQGFLANKVNLGLYLTSEHAHGEDTTSAIGVSDSDAGDIHRSGCLNRFVELTATFRRYDREIFLGDPKRIVEHPAPAGDYVATVCWQRELDAAQQADEPDVE